MKKILIAICMLALLSSPASAQQKRQDLMGIEAKVVDTKTVKFTNASEEHLLAKIELQSKQGGKAKRVVADFGPLSTLEKQGVGVDKGSKFRGQGSAGMINKRPVLFIYSFDLDTESQNQLTGLNKSEQRARMSAKDAGVQNPRIRFIEGEIVAMKDVDVKGLSDKQRLLRIKSPRLARSFIISAGTEKTLSDLSLEVGDTVLVKGIGGKINNRRVVFATELAEVAEVDRGKQESSNS